MRFRSLMVALIIPVAVVVCDRLLFDRVLFSLSNPSGWDSFRWYNFESVFRDVERRRSSDTRPLIIAVGSSIAQYSILPREMENHLGGKYHVELISHAAMLPTDLLNYRKRIAALKPAAVVWTTNPVDLDLERLTPIWEAGPYRSQRTERNFVSRRIPARLYYPDSIMREPEIGAELTSAYAVRTALYSARYPRDEWLPFVQFVSDWNGPLKSYLNYQGIPIAGGIFREGFTGACFGLGEEVTGKEIWMEFPSALYSAGVRLVVRPLRGGEIATCDSFSGTEMAPSRAGWQQITLPPGKLEIRLTHVLVEGSVKEMQSGPAFQGRGVRLPGNLGRREPATQEVYLRRPNLEEARFESMSERELIQDYENRMNPPDWRLRPPLVNMGTIRLSKTLVGYAGFVETRQMADMKHFITDLAADVPVLIVNQAEHPLSLDEYVWSQWYADYVGFIQAMKSSRVSVLDLHDALPMRELGDPHHLTFHGARHVQPMMADALLKLLGK